VNTTVERPSPDVAVVALDGELDASNYRELIERGQQLYADGARRLILDLAKLTYMSSSGIVALHSLALVFRGQQPPDPEAGWSAFHAVSSDAAGGDPVEQVHLVAPAPGIAANLARTGLDRILPTFPDREAALAG
jgi:anti-anti-sigma regulatory factor